MVNKDAKRDFSKVEYTIPYSRLPSFYLVNRSISVEATVLIAKIANYYVEVNLGKRNINLTRIFKQLFIKPIKSRRIVCYFSIYIVST